ncbi:ABC transporter substrate-binding protein [Paenibacillus hemerocallicola]|nr:extracellular solute-binding protein [Paenibacillus hemerocallicola]
MFNKRKWYALLICSMAALTACSGGKDDNPGSAALEKPKEPITLTIHGGGVTEEEFNSRFKEVLGKKFPHITVNYVINAKGTMVPEMVAAGTIPDIIRTDISTLLSNYLDLGLGEDLTPYVKKYNYDLARFNKVFMDELVALGRSNALYGLPVPPYFPHVLYYNKDLFDKFGVRYPRDGMTWDEVYELAKQMTRIDNGVAYRGFSFNPGATLRDNPYSLPILDPNADKLADQEKWKLIFENYLRFFQIPGNEIAANNSAEAGMFGKGTVAMQVNQHSVYQNIPPEVKYDYVAFPSMSGAPKLMPQRGPAYFSITKQSKHKDEAFQVVLEMLSDEIQMKDSLAGLPTTLASKPIQDALGKEHAVYGKVNMNALNANQPAPFTPKRKAELPDVAGATQLALLYQSFFDAAQGKTDLNSALRQLDEKLKLEVDKERKK